MDIKAQQDYDYDVIIIGSGVSGVTLACNLAAAGKKTALIEARDWGGTTVNRGSTPKKALLALAELHHHQESFLHRGLETVSHVKWEDALLTRDWLVSDESARAKERAIKAGVETYEAYAFFEDAHHLKVNGQVLSTATIVLATGSVPRKIDIEGASYIDSSANLMRLHQQPKVIALIGAGVIAMSLISSFTELGTKVHVIQHNDRVLGNFDSELVDILVNRLKSRGAEFHMEAEAERVERSASGYQVTLTNGEIVIVDGIYDVAGRIANIGGLQLEKAGIEYTERGISVDDHLTTSQPHIFAMGDCCDAPVPKLNSYADFQAKYLSQLLNDESKEAIQYPIAPAATVYSIPKIGQVGVSVNQARQHPQDYDVTQLNMSNWQNYKRVHDDLAVIKLVVSKSDQHVAGAEIVSDTADILVNYLAILLNRRVSFQELQDIIFAYPSLATDLYGLWK